MDHRTLHLKKRLLARVMATDDTELLHAVDLVFAAAHPTRSGSHDRPPEVETVLDELERALRHPHWPSN
jgi:hypothetical protein